MLERLGEEAQGGWSLGARWQSSLGAGSCGGPGLVRGNSQGQWAQLIYDSSGTRSLLHRTLEPQS